MLVSAELECKSVYLTAFMSACVFVDSVCGCQLYYVYVPKFACSWIGRGAVLGAERF